MIPPIKNLQELQAARTRLAGASEKTYELILKDIDDLKQTLDPIKLAMKFVGDKLFNSPEGMAYDGIKNMVGKVSYHQLLTFLPWPMRIAASYLLRNYVSNVVYDKKDVILSKAADFIVGIKKFFKRKPKETERVNTPAPVYQMHTMLN